MGLPVTPEYYKKMIDEVIVWLETRTNHAVERMHIIAVLKESAEKYDDPAYQKALAKNRS